MISVISSGITGIIHGSNCTSGSANTGPAVSLYVHYTWERVKGNPGCVSQVSVPVRLW